MHLPLAMVLLFGGGTGLAFIFLSLMITNRYIQLMREVLSVRMKWVMGSAFLCFLCLYHGWSSVIWWVRDSCLEWAF